MYNLEIPSRFYLPQCTDKLDVIGENSTEDLKSRFVKSLKVHISAVLNFSKIVHISHLKIDSNWLWFIKNPSVQIDKWYPLTVLHKFWSMLSILLVHY